MLRQTNFEFEAAQHQRGDHARHQDCGQHCRYYDVEEIVSRVQRGDADYQRDQHINHAGLCDFVVKRLAQPFKHDTTRQVGYCDQADECGHQERERRENY